MHIATKTADSKITNIDSVAVVTKNKSKDIMQIIYFDFDNATLSNLSINTVKQFLKKYRDQINDYIIIGHTDTKGTSIYNKKLSLMRAEAIKSILINEGINPIKINVLGKGEEALAIITPDEVKHPANRRAEIRPAN